MHVYYFLFELYTRTVVYGTETWTGGGHAVYCCSLSLHLILQHFSVGWNFQTLLFISYNTIDVQMYLHHSRHYGPPHIFMHVITLVQGGRTKHMHCKWMVWCSQVHKWSMATEVLDRWAS